MAVSDPQFVDPVVSQRKFDREVAEFRLHAEKYGRRGWYLVDARFPHALVILATAKTQPIAILVGVAFDYTNYDVAPPSVRLVHPLTREPYNLSDLPTQLLRMPAPTAGAVPLPPPGGGQPQPPGTPQAQILVAQPLMQAHDNDTPFLCVAGVREYHEHPAHTGDHWELHRTSGAGRLIRLVEIISKYGPETISGFDVQMIPKIRLHQGVPPE